MTTAPFIPPRLNLVKNENSMPTGSQPFVVKLEGLYKIENGRLIGKLEELKRTQEVMPHQVCQVNESHFKINFLSPLMITISGVGGEFRSASISQYGVGPTGMPLSNSWVANGMTISNSGFTVAPVGVNLAEVGRISLTPIPINVNEDLVYNYMGPTTPMGITMNEASMYYAFNPAEHRTNGCGTTIF